MIMILKILLTGKNGQVGAELARQLPRLGGVLALDREQLDLTKPKVIQRAIRETKPRIIVNAAAYTAVDKAEEEESIARTVNAEAPGVMAEEAKKIGALLVHYSTDYVFNGTKTTPYTEEDPPNPISAYGRTKFAGEQAIRASGVPHLIFRTAWIYATRGRNFLLTILRLATQREELRIVHDQIGAPSWGREIARATTEVLEQVTQQGNLEQGPSLRGGIYHMTAAGMTNWYDFALAILEEAALVPPDVPWFEAATGGKPLIARRIVPISTQEYPTPARRPQYSVLSNSRLVRDFGIELPHWRSQLRSAVTLDGVSNNIQ
jgi:dTDP-4-dehydrorhamnose reductase